MREIREHINSVIKNMYACDPDCCDTDIILNPRKVKMKKIHIKLKTP